ncbi:hypothetical protein AAY473_006134 [Plecturocebus cupreus]
MAHTCNPSTLGGRGGRITSDHEMEKFFLHIPSTHKHASPGAVAHPSTLGGQGGRIMTSEFETSLAKMSLKDHYDSLISSIPPHKLSSQYRHYHPTNCSTHNPEAIFDSSLSLIPTLKALQLNLSLDMNPSPDLKNYCSGMELNNPYLDT